MAKFEHFIITPFNVDIGILPREKILDSQFLQHRLNLFQEFCYPHVYQQTNQNFKWLVFFDLETNIDIKKQIEKLSDWNNFLPVYTPPDVDFQPFLVEWLTNYLSPDTTHLITSWLDNDDAIAKNYIELTQQQFRGQKFEYINFPFGYLLSKKGFYLREYFGSAFPSLIEENNNFLTCKVMSHSKIYSLNKEGLPVKQVITQPMWIQLVHEDNWKTKRDINVVPLLKIKTNKNFLNKFNIYWFNSEFHLAQSNVIKNYIESYIIKNQYNKSLGKRLRNFAAIFSPSLSIVYQQVVFLLTDKNRSPIDIDIAEIKKLCLKQETYWRKT